MNDQSSSATSRTHPLARWGLLLVTLAMGGALVISALAGFVAARRTSLAVSQVSGELMVRAVGREVRRSRGDLDEGLRSAFEELQDQGIRFIGIVSPEAELIASVGEPVAPIARPAGWKRGQGPVVERVARGSRIRVGVPLRKGLGGPGRRGMREAFDRQELQRGWLVLEFEPVLARQFTSRALWNLVLSLIAALILVLAAVVFWRLSRRSDRIQLQLAEDRRLKVLGQMSAVLGHELRNPLASLKGHAQLLLEKLGQDHPGRRGAETVVAEASRIELLTGQILDFARTGKLQRSLEDPAEMARAAVDRSAAEPVELRIDEGVKLWSLDRARMEQVLVNLLNNARQASPDDAVVGLALAIQGDSLRIEVTDRGDGLPPGEEERIFEAFHTKRVRGTGLGLALARRIVEEHGGRISAHNRPDGGALFRVELPAE